MEAQFFILQAGGNMGGDLDQIDRPVLEGAWYVASQDTDPEIEPNVQRIVAGPFPSRTTARHVARDCNRWQVPTPDKIQEQPGRTLYRFGDADERDRWINWRFPDRKLKSSPGTYRTGRGRTLTVFGGRVTLYDREEERAEA